MSGVSHGLLVGILGLLTLLAFVTGAMMLLRGGKSLPGVDDVPATVDNELRFYSAYWIGYGALCAWTATELAKHARLVPILAAILLLSGIGRFLSLKSVGKPAPMFIPIMIFEIVAPVVMIALYLGLPSA